MDFHIVLRGKFHFHVVLRDKLHFHIVLREKYAFSHVVSSPKWSENSHLVSKGGKASSTLGFFS